MDWNQETISSIFKRIITKQMDITKAVGVQAIANNVNAAKVSKEASSSVPKQRPLSRPKKNLMEPVLLQIKQESENDASPKSKKGKKRRRGNHTN
jgi:hypothetical protein